ncbi:alanine racemase [Desulfotruncus alcoholivorax]|uniref:alanine racemase n=1 Tax=Desulfotruncus alcoholivorax TaxID=265477 RepID=UPI000415EA47|nr:alanine racemase [Desulfotruncus alcoholivorax]
MFHHAPVWAEVNLNSIANNVRNLKKITAPGAELMAVVKADAYGHGAIPVARTLLENGATFLGVARVSEGIILRQAGIDVPVLVLGYTVPEDFDNLISYQLTQTIYNLETAELLSAAAARSGKKALVHIKIDTGMGRLGFLPGQGATVKAITRIARLPCVDVEGIFTHFADADSKDKTYTLNQWTKFRSLLDQLAKEGMEFRYRHAANSAGILDLPETHLDLVRAGIAIYGIYPSGEVCRERAPLIPAMQLKARIAHIKNVSAGTGISYGVTHRTKGSTTIATIPAGYADGYSRLLSSRGQILARGQRAPVVGRICMDQFMVDVGNIPDLEPGEEVVLMGSQGNDCISADEIAGQIGTIAYEVLCSISARVPRYYINPR